MAYRLSQPDITPEDIAAVTEVLRSPSLALGPRLDAFEKAFAEYVGTAYAVGVNSGTSALHLAVRALDIGAGDEVITTPFSFVASANCALFERAVPKFVDIDPDEPQPRRGRRRARRHEKDQGHPARPHLRPALRHEGDP